MASSIKKRAWKDLTLDKLYIDIGAKQRGTEDGRLRVQDLPRVIYRPGNRLIARPWMIASVRSLNRGPEENPKSQKHFVLRVYSPEEVGLRRRTAAYGIDPAWYCPGCDLNR